VPEAKRVKVKPKAAGGRSLETYRQKRDPASTPEPFGEARAARGGEEHLFVIQQHSARRMHWDFRLEIDGVLASWAVPKGPSVDTTQRRLAVQTEDHPLEYADFEGVIPAGNYGAGAVIVWDRGTYRIAGEGSPAEGLAAGKLDLEMLGHKLRGRWALVRLRRGGERDWLLIHKGTKRAAPPELVRTQPGSVLSGLTVEELRDGVSRGEALGRRARELGAPRRAVDVRSLRPMLAETAPEAFSRPGWIFELKYDGVRALSARDADGAVRTLSRNQRNVTASFPEIASALEHLPCERFIIDGEIIALDERGVSSFERLQRRLGLTERSAVAQVAAEVPLVMYCFDLLAVDGYDLRGLPLSERKSMLRQLVPRAGVLRFSDHVEEQGRQLFEAAQQHVLIAGYAFDHGEEILRPLHEAMVERNVRAQIFLDILGEAASEDAIALPSGPM
jgi:bifunctional non-homologous end joining protein LigD